MSTSSAKNKLSGAYDTGCKMQDVRSHDVFLINQRFMEFLVGCLV